MGQHFIRQLIVLLLNLVPVKHLQQESPGWFLFELAVDERVDVWPAINQKAAGVIKYTLH